MTATVAETTGLVGAGVDRVDGPAKVTGAARYPADFGFANLAYAVLVQSTQVSALQPRDLESYGVGADVNRSKRGHGGEDRIKSRKIMKPHSLHARREIVLAKMARLR